jgi:hypothetical protein
MAKGDFNISRRSAHADFNIAYSEVKVRMPNCLKTLSNKGKIKFDVSFHDGFRYYAPRLKKSTALLAKLKELFRQNISQPVERVIEQINPILRGWVNYFVVGDSSGCFSFVRDWVEKKVRGHLMRARERSGLGWKRWSRKWLYEKLGLYNDYRLRRPWSLLKVQPAESVT